MIAFYPLGKDGKRPSLPLDKNYPALGPNKSELPNPNVAQKRHIPLVKTASYWLLNHWNIETKPMR